jgi:hypothetical protein
VSIRILIGVKFSIFFFLESYYTVGACCCEAKDNRSVPSMFVAKHIVLIIFTDFGFDLQR